MARRFTTREYEALCSLMGNPAWERMLEWMQSTLAQERRDNDRQPNEVLLRQAQGWCQCLDTLVTGAAEAPQIMRQRQTVKSAPLPRV